MAAPDFRLSEVLTRPQRTFTVAEVDYQSVWNALHNPLKYTIGVYGDIVDYIDNTVTGGVDMYMHDITIAATYTVGDKIFLYSTALTTNYANGYYTVTNVSGHYVTIDAIYTGDITGTGYVTNFNLKPNFKIEIELWAIQARNDVNTPVLIATSRYTPFAPKPYNLYEQMQATVDVSTFMQGVIKKVEDEISYNTINEIDSNNFSYFYIRYRESYTNSIDAWINDPSDISPGVVAEDANTCYVSKSVKQLQATNGSSLFEYESFDTSRVPNAKFISGFSRPKYYRTDYPFDLTFIDSFAIFNDGSMNAYFTPYTSAGVAGTPYVVALNVYDVPSIQRLWIDLPFGDEGDWDNADYFSVFIGTDTDEIYINPIYITIVNTLTLCNPVYLKAKNDLGCWDYFMFERNQEIVQDSVSGGVFNPFENDLETDNTNSDYIAKLSRNNMVIGANGISVIDFNAYTSLARSPKVYMLTNSAYPWQWTTVKLRGNTIKRNTRQSTFDCEFILDMPDTYNLTS